QFYLCCRPLPALLFALLFRQRPPTLPPPLPYTTLFRSPDPCCTESLNQKKAQGADRHQNGAHRQRLPIIRRAGLPQKPEDDNRRSEEHTSELQSRENLVCRLLLEKKKHPHS